MLAMSTDGIRASLFSRSTPRTFCVSRSVRAVTLSGDPSTLIWPIRSPESTARTSAPRRSVPPSCTAEPTTAYLAPTFRATPSASRMLAPSSGEALFSHAANTVRSATARRPPVPSRFMLSIVTIPSRHACVPAPDTWNGNTATERLAVSPFDEACPSEEKSRG